MLLISPLPPPPGGIATWTLNLLKYFEPSGKLNANIELVHLSNARRFGAITDKRFLTRIFSGILNFIFFFKKFFINLKFGKKQLVHITSSGSFSILRDLTITVVSKIYKAEVLIHIRFGRVPTLYQSRNLEGILFKFLVSLADKIVTIDEHTFLLLSKRYPAKVVYLPNPVSDSFLENVTQKSGLEKNQQNHIILFVGHVIAQKGIYDLIKALDDMPNIHLKIAGYVTQLEKERVIKAANNYPDLHLSILGNLNQYELQQELNSCTLFCLPSHSEGFPNAVLEAMASEVPMVVSDVGEIPSMIRYNGQETAWIFKAKDVSGLRTAILSALADPEEREKRANLAKTKVLSSYTSPKVFGDLQNIWLA